MVESPRYLVSQRRLKEAYSSLQKLRGPENEIDVHKELDEMMRILATSSNTAAKAAQTIRSPMGSWSSFDQSAVDWQRLEF
ncbi:hypothetical protein BGZ54_009739 [Gamsiella multidivaricata]|nr:hypothetical protein BGZ54_009739 [Gamsiella multidivaricata]